MSTLIRSGSIFMAEQSTTLVVLAGGYGSRIGMPKGQLRVDGRPILEHLVARLCWKGPTLIITAPGMQHPPGWQRIRPGIVRSGRRAGAAARNRDRAGIRRAVGTRHTSRYAGFDDSDARMDRRRAGDARGIFFDGNGRIESMPVLLKQEALAIAAPAIECRQTFAARAVGRARIFDRGGPG